MSYIEGAPIETATEATQAERNRVAAVLIDLTLRELFEFAATQSDSNFANYRYDAATGKIILLDFGATRYLDPLLTNNYRDLTRAGLAGDAKGLRNAAIQMKFIDGNSPHDEYILAMINVVFDALRTKDKFDFSDSTLSNRLTQDSTTLARSGYVPPPLPLDNLYLQRKFGGMFLLASRLKANLPVREQLESYVG